MPKKLYRLLILLAISSIILALPALWLDESLFAEFFPEGKSAGNLEVAFLDVGQGDATLIKTPMGQNILIDGGPDRSVLDRLSQELPWWDRTIDLMILTHPHDDHVAGLVEVIKAYQVKEIAYSGVSHTAPAYLEWLDSARSRKIPMTIIDRPQKAVFGEHCALRFLFPIESYLSKAAANLNNASLVAELDCQGKSILFMGDAETEVENRLIESGSLPDVDIVKIGHHGSDTSSSWEFLQAIEPETAVISVGKDNKFSHPSLRVVKRLERIGAEVQRTDLVGTIVR